MGATVWVGLFRSLSLVTKLDYGLGRAIHDGACYTNPELRSVHSRSTCSWRVQVCPYSERIDGFYPLDSPASTTFMP